MARDIRHDQQPRPRAAAIQRSSPLAVQVHAALCQSITSGARQPGERVVLEHIAEELGVSPTPVREALNRLIQAGLISEGPAGRLRIVDLTPSYVTDTFYVRGALEGVAAELATPVISEAMLDTLRDALVKGDAAVAGARYDTYMEVDVLLHRAVSAAAGNAVLFQELRHLQMHVDFIRVYSRRHAGDHIRLSQQEHWAVLEALKSRDAGAARAQMESHIRRASRRIVELIDFETGMGDR